MNHRLEIDGEINDEFTTNRQRIDNESTNRLQPPTGRHRWTAGESGDKKAGGGVRTKEELGDRRPDRLPGRRCVREHPEEDLREHPEVNIQMQNLGVHSANAPHFTSSWPAMRLGAGHRASITVY